MSQLALEEGGQKTSRIQPVSLAVGGKGRGMYLGTSGKGDGEGTGR